MNTQNNQLDNKLSLRASLKKEGESLSARLADSASPLLTDRIGVVASDGLPNIQSETGKTNISVGGMPAPGVIKAPGGQAPVSKSAQQKAKKIGGKVPATASRDTALAAGKDKKHKKNKPEKMVRYELALPKNEDVAIDTLRADLAKATGWKASKSEIVRAAVQLFAAQKAGSMRQLLATVTPPAKGRKKS